MHVFSYVFLLAEKESAKRLTQRNSSEIVKFFKDERE